MKKTNNLLFILGFLLILVVTILFQFSQIYPKTGDYIPYLIITEQIKQTGSFSSFNPYHQLGVETSVQPTVPILLSILSNITGIDPLFLVKISALFFMFSFLSSIIFLRSYSPRWAILGGLVYCLLPLNLDILSWGSLHNFMALFLIPLFLYYLIKEESHSEIIASILLVSILFINQLPFLFLFVFLILSLFLLWKSKNKIKKSLKIVILTGLIGIIPLINFIKFTFLQLGTPIGASSASYAATTQTFFIFYSSIILILALFGILISLKWLIQKKYLAFKMGAIYLLFILGILLSTKILNINFLNVRFLWYIGIIFSVFIILYFEENYKKYNPKVLMVVLSLFFICLLFFGMMKGIESSNFYYGLTEKNYDAITWFKLNNNVTNKILLLDHNMMWAEYLLSLKSLVASPENLVGTSYQRPLAEDARKILSLDAGYMELISKYHIEYIFLSKNKYYSIGKDQLAKIYINKNFKKVYENEEVVIFKVNIPSFNSSSPTSNSTITATN